MKYCIFIFFSFLYSLTSGACPLEFSTPIDDFEMLQEDLDAGRTGACLLNSKIISSATLKADKLWYLSTKVTVGDNIARTSSTQDTKVTLTIEPGTLIYADDSQAYLLIDRGGKIHADAWVEAEAKINPIVFTYDEDPSELRRGMWGGLVINGSAKLNSCSNNATICEEPGEGQSGFYGGDFDADNSGVLRGVRVQYAGYKYSGKDELNGISFQGVGSGTLCSHVQVHANLDDGVEFFGGTVGCQKLVLTAIGDDSLDWTQGWRGSVKEAVIVQYADRSGDLGDHAIEGDNLADFRNLTPISRPHLSQMTIIASNMGVLLREGTSAVITHSIVTGSNKFCFDIDHMESFTHAQRDEDDPLRLTFSNSFLTCPRNFFEDEKISKKNGIAKVVAPANEFSVEDWFLNKQVKNQNKLSSLKGVFPTTTEHMWSDGSYSGAFESEVKDWTKGWILEGSLDPNFFNTL